MKLKMINFEKKPSSRIGRWVRDNRERFAATPGLVYIIGHTVTLRPLRADLKLLHFGSRPPLPVYRTLRFIRSVRPARKNGARFRSSSSHPASPRCGPQRSDQPRIPLLTVTYAPRGACEKNSRWVRCGPAEEFSVPSRIGIRRGSILI